MMAQGADKADFAAGAREAKSPCRPVVTPVLDRGEIAENQEFHFDFLGQQWRFGRRGKPEGHLFDEPNMKRIGQRQAGKVDQPAFIDVPDCHGVQF